MEEQKNKGAMPSWASKEVAVQAYLCRFCGEWCYVDLHDENFPMDGPPGVCPSCCRDGSGERCLR